MASPYSEAEKGQGQQRPSPRPGAPTPTSARPRSNVSGSSRARPGSVVSWMRSSEPRSPNDQRRPPLPKLNTSAKPARQATVDSQVAQPPKTPHTAHTHRQESDASIAPPEEGFSDPSSKMWMLYISEAEKHDKEISDSLKGDMEGILVFTGLFSAAIATFLVESYQQLSPDSGNQTVTLLAQISQQLNGTELPGLPTADSFTPTASAVRVNVVWFLSLVLSLACALSATLMQQWSRRYQQLTQRRGTPHKRGRVRAYLFGGIQRSRLVFVVDVMTAILHAAVGLFLVGLFEFLLPINKTLAYVVLGFECAFALVYSAITLAPNIFMDCPYNSPLSGGVWRLSQLAMIVWLRLRSVTKENLGDQIMRHQKRLRVGLRESILDKAADAPSKIDKAALEWTLKELDEDWEIETFVARMPGFFDSTGVKEADKTFLGLLEPGEGNAESILGFQLHNMLKSSLAEDGVLNAKTRSRRLHGALRALWYCARAYCTAGATEGMPSYVRARFAEPNLVNALWEHKDPYVRVVSRCTGALLAQRLIRDVRARIGKRLQNSRPMSAVEPAEAAALVKLTQPGEFNNLQLEQPGPAELLNVTALARSILDPPASTKPLSPRAAAVVSQTFVVLGDQLQKIDAPVSQALVDRTLKFFTAHDPELRKLLGDAPGLDEIQRCLGFLTQRMPAVADDPGDIDVPQESDESRAMVEQEAEGSHRTPVQQRQYSGGPRFRWWQSSGVPPEAVLEPPTPMQMSPRS